MGGCVNQYWKGCIVFSQIILKHALISLMCYHVFWGQCWLQSVLFLLWPISDCLCVRELIIVYVVVPFGLRWRNIVVFWQVARQLQPSVIWIDDAEKTFYKKVPKLEKEVCLPAGREYVSLYSQSVEHLLNKLITFNSSWHTTLIPDHQLWYSSSFV